MGEKSKLMLSIIAIIGVGVILNKSPQPLIYFHINVIILFQAGGSGKWIMGFAAR